jgi:hypothetical protein
MHSPVVCNWKKASYPQWSSGVVFKGHIKYSCKIKKTPHPSSKFGNNEEGEMINN